MHDRDYLLFIEDILNSCNKIIKYVKNKSYEEFIKDEITVDAVIRNLEIIGEAAKRIPYNIKQTYDDVEWRKISNLRNILIHEYFGIKHTILWDVVKNKVPKLKNHAEKILNTGGK